MSEYSEAIDYLYGLQYHGIKLGLNNTRTLLRLLNDPQSSFRSIHIAGTNGKGSTSSLIASVLRKAGFTVGLFTSPHLVSFTERIRVNGERIPEEKVIELTDRIRELINEEPGFSPTFFEFVTALGFEYFREQNVEWAVVETGMGGRLDATNILAPVVQVITPIGLDHKEFLGSTLREIAGEKAGIIKEGVPLVTTPHPPEAEEVILSTAEEKKSPAYLFGRDFTVRIAESDTKGNRFDYVSKMGAKKDLSIPLPGRFQVSNASLAIKTVELVNDSRITPEIIKEGLSSVSLEGRCEMLDWKFPLLLDGAHNPDAAASLAATLDTIYRKEYKGFIFIIGMMGDKEVDAFLSALLPLAKSIIFTTLAFERAARAERLQDVAVQNGYHSHIADTAKEALAMAGREREEGDLVVLTGSFYAVGEAKGVTGADTSLYGLTEFR